VTWLIHVCDMNHSCVWHDSFMCVTWLIHVCDMTHSCVWHDSRMCLISLIHMCDMTHKGGPWYDRESQVCVWHDSFICVTWLIHMCDMPHKGASRCDLTYVFAMAHSHVWRDSCICVTWLIKEHHDVISDMSSYGSFTFTCVTWLMHMCDVTHSYLWHDS